MNKIKYNPLTGEFQFVNDLVIDNAYQFAGFLDTATLGDTRPIVTAPPDRIYFLREIKDFVYVAEQKYYPLNIDAYRIDPEVTRFYLCDNQIYYFNFRVMDLVPLFFENKVSPNTYSFKINDRTYLAEIGMQWRDWILSKYNTPGYINNICITTEVNPKASILVDYNNTDGGGVYWLPDEMNSPIAGRTYVMPEFIDLGLRSGVKWATFNIGAANIYEPGWYFAYGETATKAMYDQETYRGPGLRGFEQGSPLYDAATAVWCKQRTLMPTMDQYLELLNSTRLSFYEENGIRFARLTSPVNGNFIVFPMTGLYIDDSIDLAGDTAYYHATDGFIRFDYANRAYKEIPLDDQQGVFLPIGIPVRAIRP